MKKILIIAFLLSLPIAFFASDIDVWQGDIVNFDATGKGDSADSPILIESAAQLAYLSEQVSAGEPYQGIYFKLTTDVDLDNKEWTPIGWHNTNANNAHFKGHFDGGGHFIKNISVTTFNKDSSGLFGATSSGATIKNVGLESGSIEGKVVGGIVGNMSGGRIENCYNKASIKGANYVGGIVAYSTTTPTLNNCFNAGTLTLTLSGSKSIGGIMGQTTTAYISNCYNAGDIVLAGGTTSVKFGAVTGDFNASRAPVNCYYLDTTVPSGATNSHGTAVDQATILSEAFVPSINGSQYPVAWYADHESNNGGLPMLLWQYQRYEAPDFPMVPGTVVVHSPKSSGIYRGTPMITIMPNGNYIAGNDVFGDGVSNVTDIYISKNKGASWQHVSSIPGPVWSSLFNHNNVLYLIGGDTSSGANFVIRSSSDEGKTWSAPTVLIPGACHGSSTPVLFANGRIHKAYEHNHTGTNPKWMSDNRSFIISAPEDANLMDAASWTVTDEMAKPAWLDGTGWLESNAVIGRDGKIKGISRLASMEGIYAGYYSLSSDSKIDETSLRKIPFYGGASKFNIEYDAVTDKYWSLANYAPLEFRKENISAGGLRSVLALTSSTDLEEWTVNAIVLADTDYENVGFQYVDFSFDEDDIVFVSRTAYDDGMGGADNYHNANFMTFHRIENYQTATTPSEWEYLLPTENWDGKVVAFDDSGDIGSSADNPIVISHPGHLVYLSEQVYQGNAYENKYFKMINDIDLNRYNFLPIGWYITSSNNKAFSGVFDGGGYKVLNLKINRNDDNYTSNALFGYLKSATVSNLGIDGESDIYLGGIVGGIAANINAAKIFNCYNKANVTGTSYVGGIAGYSVSSPQIANCYNRGNIHLNSTTATNKAVGGILGYFNTGSVSNTYNAGNITAGHTDATTRGPIVGTTKAVVNSYFLDTSATGGNENGISKSNAEMITQNMVDLLNASQNPLAWSFDIEENNENYPVLAWENPPLEAILTLNNIPCFSEANGSIKIEITGAVGTYKLFFKKEADTEYTEYPISIVSYAIEIENLDAGKYNLYIENPAGNKFPINGEDETIVEVTQPELLVVSLGDDIELCGNQSATLSGTFTGGGTPISKYEWTGPNSFTSNDEKITVADAGIYHLTVTNESGCVATDNIKITSASEDFDAELIIENDTYYVNQSFEIKNNIYSAYSQVEWLINTDDDPVKILESSDNSIKLVFEKTGRYTVGCRIKTQAGCNNDMVENIYISSSVAEVADEPLIVHPKTNNGVFNLHVKLDEVSPVTVRIVSMNGVVVSEKSLSGEQRYEIPYHIAVPNGIYLITVKTNKKELRSKMLIK